MLSYLIQSSELSTLFRFVSPAFFRVVPMSDLLGVASRLKKNASDSDRFQAVRSALATRLETGKARVIVQSFGETSSQGGSLEGFESGNAVLEAYFLQVLTAPVWVLDFRKEAFQVGAEDLRWDPRPYFWEPSPDFAEGVRRLYRGFYQNSPELFEEALGLLRLQVAGPALRKHFGEGDQTAVKFELKSFQNSFAEVFEACAREKAQIPPEFAVLGLMLLSLYENLEAGGIPLDVRTSFLNAERMAAVVV